MPGPRTLSSLASYFGPLKSHQAPDVLTLDLLHSIAVNPGSPPPAFTVALPCINQNLHNRWQVPQSLWKSPSSPAEGCIRLQSLFVVEARRVRGRGVAEGLCGATDLLDAARALVSSIRAVAVS